MDAWAVEDASLVYPRSLELMAESGAFDILVAQADLSQFRDPGNDEWCELTLRTLAALRDRTGVFVAGTTVHSADPPGPFRSSHASCSFLFCAGPGMPCSRSGGSRALLGSRAAVIEPGASPDLTDLLAARHGALSEHRVGAGAGATSACRSRRDAVAAAAPDGGGTRRRTRSDSPVVVKLDGPRRTRARAGGVVLGLDVGRGGQQPRPSASADARCYVAEAGRRSRARRCCAA